MNKYLGMKVPKCGAMDSKYFGHPEQFDKDIQKRQFDSELFRAKVRNLILEEPAKMDTRFHQAMDELREIKEEFNL